MKRFILFVLGGVIICSTLYWAQLPQTPVEVTIPPGASAREVSTLLHRSGVIFSPTLFVYALRFSGKVSRVKAGTYLLSRRLTLFAVIERLIEGRVEAVKVTIPEGFTAVQVAERLGQMQIVDSEAFLTEVARNNLEGYLYPETYFFEPHSREEKIAGSMASEFKRHFTHDMQNRAQELKMKESDIVTLASIIEKEAVRPEERPIIAGVFYNRLKKRWYLESCATVLYALGEHKARLSLKDLKVDSPYNTYRHQGLPPGPICNPGIESIKAALYPAATEDMFFVAQGSGTHAFSRYYGEHLKNKKASRKKTK